MSMQPEGVQKCLRTSWGKGRDVSSFSSSSPPTFPTIYYAFRGKKSTRDRGKKLGGGGEQGNLLHTHGVRCRSRARRMAISQHRCCLPALGDALPRPGTHLLWVQPHTTAEPRFTGKHCLLSQVKHIRDCGLKATYGAGSAQK